MMTAAQYQLRTTEADMEATIRDAVGSRGRVFHIRDSRAAPEMQDFPDLVIVLPPRVFLIELKSQSRRVTTGQTALMQLLGDCSRFESGIVRPEPKHESEISFEEFINWISGGGL